MGTLREDGKAQPPTKKRKREASNHREQLIKGVFKHFDQNGDQLLSANEMLNFATWR